LPVPPALSKAEGSAPKGQDLPILGERRLGGIPCQFSAQRESPDSRLKRRFCDILPVLPALSKATGSAPRARICRFLASGDQAIPDEREPAEDLRPSCTGP